MGVDKQIPVSVMKYTEKIVPYAVTIEEERPIEVPQVLTVEITTQRPNPQYQQIPKQIARVQMQYRERVVELRDQVQEQIVVPQVQMVEYIQQPQAVTMAPQMTTMTMAPQMTTMAPQSVTMAPQMTTMTGGFAGATYGGTTG